MDEKTTEKLLALNREFYAAFAQPFAASRPVSDPALTCILPHIPLRARVLDVGCGNGRLALLLDRERPGATYLGVDAVPEIIEVARAQADQLTTITATFEVADVAWPGWSERLQDALPSASLRTSFDCIVCLAVLHHIPGFDLRLRILRDIASLLTPGGLLILSTWQFLESERMRRKIVEWAEASIPEEPLEPGDYLLDWKREGRGLRYCHLVDEGEINRLVAESGLRVRETFRAGGREGNLSLFAILDKSA
ncbi:MAG: class I SAM-dependent methyltransferase [Chloroflexi bacterium]|nr:class I SAM-dependent methyltransferase [Chloroflexota bacterium]